MARKYPTTEDNLCTNLEGHPLHICSLNAAGRTEEIRKRTDQPRFACFNCGARANEEKSLCNPTPLAGEAET
ncbi:hypothetical protein SAMN05660860_01589 [Geoalkalibacter ferrihydriticus]|uniref:Uncharacterized protein n=2 Tax=Geoalkalibacter ferrihydriticus TaxID=392333 RepID=A0A0C2HUI1_9BACT|nr:hypothetical protein [Geoalkalibacter ferrihydriticus]KIH76487.1 hypothetical protein GFER_09875 [Geoalkalibacter ferrihydriticus DSM 17813]SDL97853.1 hypothetical protein SAMN05660860_01589 [Geoalkalibacter ferrihydriticus]